MNVHTILEMAAEAAGDRVAVTCNGQSLTYEQLLAQARGAAEWLTAEGAPTVCYVGLNDITFPVLMFGASIAGKHFTPVNYRLADADLNRLLERSAPAVAVVDEDVARRLQPNARITRVLQAEAAQRSRDAAPAVEVGGEMHDPENVAVLLFTSGTTSEPKAAMLRHRNLTSYVIGTVEFLSADEDEAALVSVPPYHIAGVSTVISSTFSGRRMVLLPAFTPEAWVETAARERITHAMVVPTMLGRILDVIEARKEHLPALRHLSYGGGRMPLATIERALALLPEVNFVNAYGLTETSSTISVLTPDDHRMALSGDTPGARARLASVGRPSPAIELEIRDPHGAVCAPHVAGEIWVRGEQVSGEYVGKQSTTEGGWYATNDAGWLDDEGYLFVEGRLDDVIVRGGENIAPAEIEDVLRTHPGVADVAVIGAPDDEWGEQIVAYVVPHADAPAAADLQDHVRGRLRSTRVPAQVIFREELPYNETGKLLRRVLRGPAKAG